MGYNSPTLVHTNEYSLFGVLEAFDIIPATHNRTWWWVGEINRWVDLEQVLQLALYFGYLPPALCFFGFLYTSRLTSSSSARFAWLLQLLITRRRVTYENFRLLSDICSYYSCYLFFSLCFAVALFLSLELAAIGISCFYLLLINCLFLSSHAHLESHYQLFPFNVKLFSTHRPFYFRRENTEPLYRIMSAINLAFWIKRKLNPNEGGESLHSRTKVICGNFSRGPEIDVGMNKLSFPGP